MSLENNLEKEFDNVFSHLKEELSKLRTGRATPTLVESLKVEYYGTKTPLNQLASISSPDAKTIIIQPWDTNAAKEIEKAIHNSSLGLNPVNEGKLLRIIVPPLTEERRDELTKLVTEKIEESKVRIRTIREEHMKKMQKEEDDGVLREDDYFKGQKKLQESVDEANKRIKESGDLKVTEIQTL